jgi:DNA-binding MarR family transcriptional regulator
MPFWGRSAHCLLLNTDIDLKIEFPTAPSMFLLTIVVITTILPTVSTKKRQEMERQMPTGNLEEEVYLSLLRTAERLSRGLIETLSRADLTPTQYNALRILRGAGREGASCSEVGERMVTKDSDITRLLDRLDARGLISRERETEDRRRIVTRITGKGLRVLSELDKPVLETHHNQLGHLGGKRLASLGQLLEAARRGLD